MRVVRTIHLDWIFNPNGISVMSKIHEVRLWCTEQFGEPAWDLHSLQHGSGESRWHNFGRSYSFVEPEDAIMFKLRWWQPYGE